jgi:hypothetical protein
MHPLHPFWLVEINSATFPDFFPVNFRKIIYPGRNRIQIKGFSKKFSMLIEGKGAAPMDAPLMHPLEGASENLDYHWEISNAPFLHPLCTRMRGSETTIWSGSGNTGFPQAA